jgi:hypothetical protein
MACAWNKRKHKIQEKSMTTKEGNEMLKDQMGFRREQIKKLQCQLLKIEAHREWNMIRQID